MRANLRPSGAVYVLCPSRVQKTAQPCALAPLHSFASTWQGQRQAQRHFRVRVRARVRARARDRDGGQGQGQGQGRSFVFTSAATHSPTMRREASCMWAAQHGSDGGTCAGRTRAPQAGSSLWLVLYASRVRPAPATASP